MKLLSQLISMNNEYRIENKILQTQINENLYEIFDNKMYQINNEIKYKIPTEKNPRMIPLKLKP